MADIIRKATNKFTKGLVMDFSPENTENSVLTHALNATLLTFNGNELSLQNDMGNARVETAYLPEGYMPVGTCEYGGIIYIVSYNPLENKSLIGCFPSPERNVSNKELGISDAKITKDFFLKFENDSPTGKINNTTQYVLLKNDNLNPGDKFLICADDVIYLESLADLYIDNQLKENPILRLNIVSVEDDGKIVYLNNSVRLYEINKDNSKYEYHILGTSKLDDNPVLDTVDIDSYRNVLSSGYNVFKSKTSGKLAILAELIMIDSYSVTHSIQKADDPNSFNVVIHTEVSPELTSENYKINPKLAYYYLEKSEGYLQGNSGVIHASGEDFYSTTLDLIYTPIDPSLTLDLKTSLSYLQFEFNFPKENTYHGKNEPYLPNYNENSKKYEYEDVLLGNIKFPEIVINNGLSFPFKYDYTIVPCMEYGKLDHLKISNTIDFSKINDFDKSSFNTWRYRIDDNLLRLTFGSEIFDTYETNKVEGLILEFYDLFGFAGSIEITDKKSYSGIFTKIISLNELGAISNKKINTNEQPYNSGYWHNINILKENDIYKFNNAIIREDSELGWTYSDETHLSDDLNDCGTLYSNLIYGVKTYLKRTDSDGNPEFIEKEKFYLFTFPIYNDYYYSVLNYNVLENPQLELMMTYRIEDYSLIYPYNLSTDLIEENSIQEGYTIQDYNTVQEYLSGDIQSDELHITKYYEYSGKSKVFLEIGLKKEYESYNLRYDPIINEKFSCNLKLCNNDASSVLDLYSNDVLQTDDSLLNYLDTWKNMNNIKFSGQPLKLEHSFKIDTSFNTYNFLSKSPTRSITLEYKFIVGHSINISNIVSTEIPVTTICALCHKNNEGKYNYEDFGIYETDLNNTSYYLSSAMLYNEGDSTKETFGVCRQIQLEGDITNQCMSLYSFDQDTQYTTNPGKLNSGDPLKNILSYIGKLTFGLPHVHGLSPSYGVNILDDYGITPTLETYHGVGDGDDDTKGIAPYNKMYLNPKFNLCVNTKNSINYNSEFISTLEYDYLENETVTLWNFADGIEKGSITVEKMRKYTGLTGEELANYNKALIDVMKKVYAYNPDYDTYQVKKGLTKIINNNLKFTTNLVNTNSAFTDDFNLNEFVYIGSTSISDYLNLLNNHLNITNLPDLVLFKPDLTYCGTPESYYIISPLSYKIEIPSEIEDYFNFTNSNLNLIKHEDGSINTIIGTPNKKCLYGYLPNLNSLIELDVSNYVITEEENKVNLKVSPIVKTNKLYSLKTSPTYGEHFDNNEDNLIPISDPTSEKIFKLANFDILELGIQGYIQMSLKETNNNIELINGDMNGFLVASNISVLGTSEYTFTIELNPVITKLIYPSSNYEINVDSITLQLKTYNLTGYMVNSNLGKGDSIETIVNALKATSNTFEITINNVEMDSSKNIIPITNNEITVTKQYEGSSNGIIAFYLIPSNITASVIKTDNVEIIKNSFIEVPKTLTYSKHKSYKYEIDEVYENICLPYTSITLNDLLYEPSINGHRLFINSNLYSFSNYLGNRLYYRLLDAKSANKINDWYYTTHTKNSLAFYTGPCFIPPES